MATTDFNEWLSFNVEDAAEALAVKNALEFKVNYGSYEYSEEPDGRIFIKGVFGTVLIANEKSLNLFKAMLEEKYAHKGMDLETTVDYDRAISKDD